MHVSYHRYALQLARALSLPAALFWSFLPQAASALDPRNIPNPFLVPTTQVRTVSDFYSITCVIGQWILVFGILIGVIFLIYGGIKYITSAGDENKASEGKKTILYAIVGIIFLILAVAIVNIVADFFGAFGFSFSFTGFFGGC